MDIILCVCGAKRPIMGMKRSPKLTDNAKNTQGKE